MYITFDNKTKKVIYIGEKKPIAVSGNAVIGEVDSVPMVYEWLSILSSIERVRNGETYLYCILKAEFFNKPKEAENKILALKRKLEDTDYQAIKYAEGFISETDYAPIKARRQAWRDEINTLESEL